VLLTTPFWAEVLYTVNIVAATVASLCGAFVGLIGVWRIVRQRRANMNRRDRYRGGQCADGGRYAGPHAVGEARGEGEPA